MEQLVLRACIKIMNIFFLDSTIKKSVQQYADAHVVKMITEHVQMLSTVCRENGLDVGYKSTHKNHPCTLWVGKSLSNWKYLRALTEELHKEWQYRYNHPADKLHGAYRKMLELVEPNISDIGFTSPAQAMPDKYKNNDTVIAYRNYYLGEKQHLLKWTNRPTPIWIKNNGE